MPPHTYTHTHTHAETQTQTQTQTPTHPHTKRLQLTKSLLLVAVVALMDVRDEAPGSAIKSSKGLPVREVFVCLLQKTFNSFK